MKIVCIAGGVGGAKLAFGLSMVLPAEDLTVVVNVGDDFTHLGLRICPDLDTVTYTLAGLDNRETGWGLAGDTFRPWTPWRGSMARPGSVSATRTSRRTFGGPLCCRKAWG